MAGLVYVANTSFSVEFEGHPLVVEGGRTIREGHPLLAAFPDFFTEIVPDFEFTPAPPKKETPSRPAAPVMPKPPAAAKAAAKPAEAGAKAGGEEG